MSALKLLAIETSSAIGSVALAIDDQVAELSIATPREQTARVLGLVDDLLVNADLRLADLDALVFGCGPGSFTGLRVAAAVTQGLSLAAGCPIVAVSSLAALAQRGFSEYAGESAVEWALCAVDARMGEVYSGHYRLADGLAVLEGSECLVAPKSVVAPVEVHAPMSVAAPILPYLALGDAFAAYAEALTALTAGAVATRSALAPRARDLLPQAACEVLAGRFLPLEAALPVYLRQADAWRQI